jgi:TP901 family phage tail tape measure protein
VSDFVVDTAFRASGNQLVSALKAQAAAATTFGQKAKLAFQMASKESSVFKSMLGANLLGSAITKATSLASRGIRSMVTEFADFDDAIGQAVAKMPEKIRRGTDEFNAIEAAARQVGRDTMFSATEAAEGLNYLAMAGFNASQSVGALPGVVALATATSMDLGRATDIASDALGAFGMMSQDTATLQANLTRINDVFAKTTNTANVDMENMFLSMKQAGPVFTAAGQSVETFSALVGKLGSAGLKGEQAGTVLRAMMIRLQGPTGKAAQLLKSLKINVENSDGSMRDIVDIIGDYDRATARMGEVEKAKATSLIFGTEAVAGMNILLAEGEDSLRGYREQLENASGTTAEMAGEIEKSLGSKIKILSSSVMELGFKFLESFVGDGKSGVDALNKAVNEFDVKPLVEGAKAALSAFKWLFSFLRNNVGTIKLLVGGFVAVKVALGAISFVKAIAGFKALFVSATAAQGAAAGAAAASSAAGAAGGGGAAAGGLTGKVGAGSVVPAAAAAYGGYVLGNIIEENWLQPLREHGQKMEVEIGNLVNRMSMKDISKMEVPELAKSMQQIRSAMYSAGPAVYSLETAWEQAGSSLMGGAATFLSTFGIINEQQAAQIAELNKGPIQQQAEQVRFLTDLYRQMAAAIVEAKAKINAAAASTTTQIDVNVANAPAGTTVESKGSKGAPRVNQSQAGKV